MKKWGCCLATALAVSSGCQGSYAQPASAVPKIAKESVLTKPDRFYYATPCESKYSDYRLKLVPAFETGKSVVLTNRIDVKALPDKPHPVRVAKAAVAYRVPPAFRAAEKPAEPASFKLMSYNVRHGKGTDGKIDLDRIAQTIHRARPRYAALQEIDICRKRTGGVDQAAELGRLTGMIPTFAKAIAPDGDGEYGVMLLSESAPLSVRRLPLPGKEPRVLLLCEFADCFVGTTHLSVATEAERMESVVIIRDAIKDCTKPVFLTGDWNATPDSKTMRGMMSFMTLLSDTEPAGGTFHGDPGSRSKSVGKCIDYVAVDSRHADAWLVKTAEVMNERIASDHAPVCVTVSRQK